jgi:hypothetical protein
MSAYTCVLEGAIVHISECELDQLFFGNTQEFMLPLVVVVVSVCVCVCLTLGWCMSDCVYVLSMRKSACWHVRECVWL